MPCRSYGGRAFLHVFRSHEKRGWQAWNRGSILTTRALFAFRSVALRRLHCPGGGPYTPAGAEGGRLEATAVRTKVGCVHAHTCLYGSPTKGARMERPRSNEKPDRHVLSEMDRGEEQIDMRGPEMHCASEHLHTSVWLAYDSPDVCLDVSRTALAPCSAQWPMAGIAGSPWGTCPGSRTRTRPSSTRLSLEAPCISAQDTDHVLVAMYHIEHGISITIAKRAAKYLCHTSTS